MPPEISEEYEDTDDGELNMMIMHTMLPFPQDYRDFLLQYNGGIPAPAGFTTRDGSVSSTVAWFFPVADTEDDPHLYEEIMAITKAGLVPPFLVPVAATADGNRIMLAVGGTELGTVYYWARQEETGGAPSFDHMHAIAGSFGEFWNSLR
jgi:hypothetical protein